MKTVTLETAKRLKELGYPQRCGFYYMANGDKEWEGDLLNVLHKKDSMGMVAAPTAGELLEWLIESIGTECWAMQLEPMDHGIEAHLAHNDFEIILLVGNEAPDSPAEALGRLTIKVLEAR